jgi:hypothetical protein
MMLMKACVVTCGGNLLSGKCTHYHKRPAERRGVAEIMEKEVGRGRGEVYLKGFERAHSLSRLKPYRRSTDVWSTQMNASDSRAQP